MMRRPPARRRVRSLAAAAAALVAGSFCGTAAVAAEPGSPSVTGVHVADRELTAILTVPPVVDGRPTTRPRQVTVTFDQAPPRRAALVPVAHETRAAMIVIDTSGSMKGTGLAAAQAAARQFLAQVPADVRVGLESFASVPEVLVAPTRDRERVVARLDALHAVGGTALYDAVVRALQPLREAGSGTLVLLSDGSDTASHATLARSQALIRSSGVRPVVVAFRTGHSQDSVLDAMAVAGRGTMTRALDPASLRRAFSAAARELSTQVRITVPIPDALSGAQHVGLMVRAGDRTLTTGVDIQLPAAPPKRAAASSDVAPAQPVEEPTAGHGTQLWAGALAVFAGLLGLALAVAAPRLAPAAKRRVRELDDYLAVQQRIADEEGPRSLQGLSEGLTRAADAYIGTRPSAERTGLLLERADLPLQLNEWYVLRVLAVPIGAAAVWMLLGHSGVLTMLLGAVVGAVAPVCVLRFLAGRRARKFELQLPDVLTLVASSLSTGFSLPQALDGITRDAAEPASKEFSRALAETRIGVDLEDALDRVAARMDSTNLAWTTMAVRIQRKVGGNLADVMRTTAKTLRERESLHRQVRALSAEGRLSAYILIALPLLLAAYLYLTNRSYLSMLWKQPLGVTMLGISGVLMVIGVFWMKRVVEVKV